MILIDIRVLERFKAAHADSCKSLESWQATARASQWQHLLDVRQNFPHADGITVTRGTQTVVFTVFNIKGNHYRLVTEIDYELETVQIKTVLTHAEYDKNKWNNL